MDVVFRYDSGAELKRRLEKITGALTVRTCGESDDVTFPKLMKNAEVLWHCLRPVTAETIAGAPRLRLIQKIGVGLNTIDLEAARARGIAVCNMPGTNSRAVAEMTLLLMLAALRRLPAVDRATREGQGWVTGPALQDHYGELGGKTVGLVGFGAVPAILTPILQAMGARVLYTARKRRPETTTEWRTLPALLAEADIVSMHIPDTPETHGIIDAAAIARMKPGTIFVNTARGGLVDEAALVAALKSGHLRAAGLDVFAEEPVRAVGNPLLMLDNVALAPHLAWLTIETFDRSLAVAVENCRRLGQGEALLHRVV
jgi:phosphoglycerate dehydrogenase-like enzyme